MQILTESIILRIAREEWNARLDSFLKESVGMRELIAPELKVIHKQSGIRYTVDSVGSDKIVLRTPEGDDFVVTVMELEDGYSVD